MNEEKNQNIIGYMGEKAQVLFESLTQSIYFLHQKKLFLQDFRPVNLMASKEREKVFFKDLEYFEISQLFIIDLGGIAKESSTHEK